MSTETLFIMGFDYQFKKVKEALKTLSDATFLIVAGEVSQFIDEELQKRGLVLGKH